MLVIVPAVAVNVPVVAPAATVDEAGTVSSPLLLDKLTFAPPVGAACERVIVQVAVKPLPNVAGAQDRELTTVAVSDTLVCVEAPP